MLAAFPFAGSGEDSFGKKARPHKVKQLIEHELGSVSSLSHDMKEMSRKVDHLTECVCLLLLEQRLSVPVPLQSDNADWARCAARSHQVRRLSSSSQSLESFTYPSDEENGTSADADSSFSRRHESMSDRI